jgi:hypothetical protein
LEAEMAYEQVLLTAAITLATAYGGVRAAQNGIYKRLDRIQDKQDSADVKLTEHGERLVRIEVTLENM